MPAPPSGVERRIGQRFTFNLPVTLREISTAIEGFGFTQDVSSRGVFFFTDLPLSEGAEIELTLKMPSEITLGESMRVRCKGRVLRILKPASVGRDGMPQEQRALPEGKSAENKSVETKIGVAVCLNGYEYLSEPAETSSDFRRISALHSNPEENESGAAVPAGSRSAD